MRSAASQGGGLALLVTYGGCLSPDIVKAQEPALAAVAMFAGVGPPAEDLQDVRSAASTGGDSQD